MAGSDIRALTCTALIDDPQIFELCADRCYQYNSVPDNKTLPYIVVKFSTEHPEPNWRNGPSHRSFQLWVHDHPGDYGNIDLIIDRAKVALLAIPNQNQVLEARYLETSPDLDDNLLDHIMRYARFQWALTA